MMEMEYLGFAKDFCSKLTRHEFQAAYAMTSAEYRNSSDVRQLADNFSKSFPGWHKFMAPKVLSSVGGAQSIGPKDVGWACISVDGSNGSGVSVIVCHEEGNLRVRDVEFNC